MNAVATLVPDADLRSDLPLLTRLLPALVSALALLPATLALQYGRDFGLTLPLLLLQALLMAWGAVFIAGRAHGQLSYWESRVAPQAARDRVRAIVWHDLAWIAVLGLAGPAALAGVLAWQAQSMAPLLGTLAVLCAGLAAGLVLGLGWYGRVPRLLLLPALLLLVLLTQPSVVKALGAGEADTVLAVLAGVALMGGWLASPRALRVCAPPLPALRPRAWLRRLLGRVWRTVPPTGAQGANAVRQLPFMIFLFLPQLQIHAERMHWLAWGQRFGDLYAALGYGLWMLALGAFATAGLIAPPLLWRHRLAPGGLTARRWAQRLVLGSLLFLVGTLGLGLALAFVSRPFAPSVWASALGDLLLAASTAAWLRGRRKSKMEGLWAVLALGLGGAVAIAVPLWLGWVPERGVAWLLLQLSLSLPLAWAALRAWARQDLNALA
ncbi:MAG TPA: hypothetical protein VGE36_09410 [Roseateles sp.]